MDLNEEELSRIALETPERDPEENMLDVVRGVDDLEMLDEKVSENWKLSIVKRRPHRQLIIP